MDADFWNNRYAAEEFVYGTEPNDFVAAMAKQIPSGPVLCLAEGEGRNAVYLAGLGHTVTAVDQAAGRPGQSAKTGRRPWRDHRDDYRRSGDV